MPPILSHPNPDLTVGADLRPRWNSAPHRRQGFHTLHRLTRYASHYRAGQVMDLRLSADLSVAARPDVGALTASPWFSAMAVIEGGFDKMGETVFVPMPDGVRKAKITSTVFYDPDGERLKA